MKSTDERIAVVETLVEEHDARHERFERWLDARLADIESCIRRSHGGGRGVSDFLRSNKEWGIVLAAIVIVAERFLA